jgi:hypothetical protein
VLERRRYPLDRMAEQMQEQKALHLESDVRIEHDAQAVEDAGPWRLQVARSMARFESSRLSPKM